MVPENSPLAAQVAGSLAGLATLGLHDLATGELAFALSAIGDGIRLEVVLPESIRAELRRLAPERVLGALRHAATLPGTWSLPVGAPADDDPGLAWALQQRDEIESQLVASRVALAPRNVWVDASAEAAALRDALDRVDLTCDGQVTRSLADALLGERLEIAAGAAWLEDAPWAEESEDAPAAPEVEEGLAARTRPSLAAITAYVAHGQAAAWVEAAARRFPDVADQVASFIERSREQRATISLVARRWERARSGSAAGAGPTTGSLSIPRPVPDLRMAAADGDGLPREMHTEHELGRLAPLDVEARILATATELTLEVFEEDVPLTTVRLGDAVATRTEGGYRWSVTIPLTGGERLALVLVDERGRRFEDEITIGDPR